MGLFTFVRGTLARLLPRFAPTPTVDTRSEWQARRQFFAEMWATYENRRYDSQSDQGFREVINEELRDLSSENLAGVFAIFGRVADAFSGIFNGPFGAPGGIDIEQNVSDPVRSLPVDDKLRDPIKKIWDWSNFDIKGPLSCLTAAVTGNCGLRVVADPEAVRPVLIRVEDPDWIKAVNFDADGNVTDVLLEYETTEGPISDPRQGDDLRFTTVKWTEYLGKNTFWLKRDGKLAAPPQPNPLGVCPYVLMKHGDTGLDFGESAFAGSTQIADAINALICHLILQIKNTVYAQWVYAGPGDRPTENIPFGPSKLICIQTDGPGGSNELKSMVTNLNFEQALQPLMVMVRELKNKHPEIRVNEFEALANQSGETIAQLRLPGEQKIKRVAIQYEHYLKRAIQIALSYGVLNGQWDLGAGKGSESAANLEAADASFRDGLEDFRFKQRPMLPRTQSELAVIRKNNADAAVSETTAALNLATLASEEEALRSLKYTDKQIEQFKKEASDQTAIAAIKAKAEARILGRGTGEIVQAGSPQANGAKALAGAGGRKDAGSRLP